MSGSSSPPQQQTINTTTRDPWSGAQPYLSNAMSSAQSLYNAGAAGSYAPYSGNTLAPVDPNFAQGWATAYGLAAGEPTGSANLANARQFTNDLVTNQGLNAGLRTSLGQFGDIYSRAQGNENPYLQGVINQQMDRANAAMSGAGRYGSGAHEAAIAQAIAPTLAQDYLARQQLQMAATGAQADIYGQGLQRADQAARLTPLLDDARFANAGRMMDLGNFYTQRAQQGLQGSINQYNALQAYPWENLARFNAIIGGAGGLGGSQVTTGAAPQQPSMWQKALGGALAGGGMGSMFGPAGMGIGAIGGGLLGMM